MTELIVEATKGDKKLYKPALLKVAGVSQYNPQDLRFEGIEGFWKFSDMAARDTGGQVPPVGVIGWFKLSGGNPKKGPNAKPGSVYLDVDGFAKATEAEKASYSPPEQPAVHEDPREAYNASPVQPAAMPAVPPIEQRILLGMAFNNLTTYLVNAPEGSEPQPEMTALWERWFYEASRGLPLTPVVDEQEDELTAAEEDAAELDEQATNHLSDQPEDFEETVLPW